MKVSVYAARHIPREICRERVWRNQIVRMSDIFFHGNCYTPQEFRAQSRAVRGGKRKPIKRIID